MLLAITVWTVSHRFLRVSAGSSPGGSGDLSLHILPPSELVSGTAPKCRVVSSQEVKKGRKGLTLYTCSVTRFRTIRTFMFALIFGKQNFETTTKCCSYLALVCSNLFQCRSRVDGNQLVSEDVIVCGEVVLPSYIVVETYSEE